MEQKEEWRQQKLKIKTSPANIFYIFKNKLDKWEASFKYDPFWLSWQTWEIIIWSIGQSCFYFFWLQKLWEKINPTLPIWYGFHSLEKLTSSKNALLIPIVVSIITPVACYFISKNVSKKFKNIKSLSVLFQISLTALTVITVSKIINIYG